MRKFWSVSGQRVEVQRHINVPMRWCEQYPARERRELWISTTGGHDIKLIVHSREMPARRGHQVTALLLGERLVAFYNATTGKQVNYVRTDPPLLLRRCDAAAVAVLSLASIAAFAFAAWPGLLVGLPMALLCLALAVIARFAWRCRTRVQVDRALDIVKRHVVVHPLIRRVKQRRTEAVGARSIGRRLLMVPPSGAAEAQWLASVVR